MIDYGVIHFACPPRCASAWFKQYTSTVLRSNFQTHVGIGGNSITPHMPTNQQVLKVSTIRNPADWLRSYYVSDLIKTHVPCVDEFLVLPKTGWPLVKGGKVPFDDFVRCYLSTMPGAIGRMFASYNADTYLRVEDLPWAAISLYESLGLAPARAKPVGRLGASLTLPPYNAALRAQVLEAESEMCDRYDYW